MKVLVTGGAGLVGSEIVDLFLKEGHEVVSLDNYVSGNRENLERAFLNKNFVEVEGDVTDRSLIDSLFMTNFDYVFHEAVSKNTVCLNDPIKDLEVNTLGTLNLLEAARKSEVKKFVYASTGSVYGEAYNFPTSESHPKNPVSFYGVSKLAAETYVTLYQRFYGLPTVILRYFHVYGHRQDSSEIGGVVPHFIRKLKSKESIGITGDGEQIRAFTHVSDIARINYQVALSEKSTGEVYNCASDERVSILSLANNISDLIDCPKSFIRFVPNRIGDIRYFDIDNSKLKMDLGFEFEVSFHDGLQKTIQELKF